MDLLSYEGIDLAEVIPRIPRKGRDRMPFGIIELDLSGIIVAYNMGEAKISGRNPKDMIGRHFFDDIAPCTKTPDFYGRFKAGVEKGSLNARFDYIFAHQMDPITVRVTMITSQLDDQTRVLVLIRILTDDERARAERDHERMAQITKSREEREQKAMAAVVKPVEQNSGSRAPIAPTATRVAAPTSTPNAATFNSSNLTIADLNDVAIGAQTVTITDAVRTRCAAASKTLETIVASGKSVYGLTSGFGPMLNNKAVAAEAHQLGLLRHLATGVGRPFSIEQTRAAMAARFHSLAQGQSAASIPVLESLALFINEGITPVVPQLGSVGASGDLTPLAHIGLALCGEGDVMWRGLKRSAAAVLNEVGLKPLALQQRDGLALVNGCSFSAGVAAVNATHARRLLRWNLLAASAYLQCLAGHSEALSPLHVAARPHAGQLIVREQLALLVKDSQRLRESAPGGAPPQDAYSLRCQTQLFGAVLDALDHHDGTVEIEINSISDNPIIDAKAGTLAHGGNFYGLHVALVSDYLRTAMCQSAAWGERAIARLVDPSMSGLPAQLHGDAGSSGLMGAQVTATALLAEIKSLCVAASIQGVSTNANNQDVVPMATMAARHTADMLEHHHHLSAILLIALSQAMDCLGNSVRERFSASARAMHQKVREISPRLNADRSLSVEINALAQHLAQHDPEGEAAIYLV